MNSRSKQEKDALLQSVTDHYEACKDAHAIALLTDWDDFKTDDRELIYKKM